MQNASKHQQINKGKLTALGLALSGALAAMAPVHSYAQQVSWTIGNLTNATIISGGGTGIAVVSPDSVGTLTNSSTITSTFSSGINNTGTIAAIINTNAIQGISGSAINNDTGHIGALTNSGSISGGNYGIGNSGIIDTLSNSATGNISGNTGIAITGTGTISTLINSGTISGASSGLGVFLRDTSRVDTINNSGLITAATAIHIAANTSLGTLINTGTIAGAIQNYTPNTLTITGGSGSTYGTLTGYGSGISVIGLIHSYSGLTLSGNQLLNDNIDVGNGATPVVLNTVTNTGVLQINNRLTINGNYVQGSGSTLVIGVVNPSFTGDYTDTGYGHLVVSGNVTLDNSTVTVKSAGFALAQGQRYVVVSAIGTISTIATSYTASGYTVTGTTQTDTSNTNYTDLVLTLSGSSSSSGSSGSSGSSNSSPINNATTSNAVSALSGLFKYSGTDSALLSVFNPAAALGSTASANKAGAQLSPTAVTSGALHAVDATTQAVNNVTNSHLDGFRVAQADGSGVATGESSRDIAFWGQVFGGRASQGLRDNISGYHANYRGLLIGADTLLTDSLRAGGLVSAGKTSVASDGDNTGSSANVNSYNLTAYATYTGSPWYINALAGAARQQYSTVRTISYTGFSGVADGSFNGLQYTTAVQAGYPLNLDAWLPGAMLTPIAGLSYSNLRQNGYTETGGNGAALKVNASSTNSLKSELGAKLEKSFDSAYGKLSPAIQLGWRHEYKDGRVQTGASFAADSTGSTAFVTQSASAVANVAVLNLGVTLLQGKSLSLNAKYTLESGGGYTAQTGSMQARWQY